MARHVAYGRGCDVHLAARDRDVGARVTNRAPWGSCGRLNETSDAFAGGKWPEIGCFVRAEVSSVSGEVVGRCCETAVAPVSVKIIRPSGVDSGTNREKVRTAGEKALILGSFGGAGELFRAWTLMEASRANFFALAWPSRG